MRILLFLFFFLLFPTLSPAAGFDCAKAFTAVEKLICGNPQLSAQDEELSVAYREATSQASDSTSLVLDQKRWLQIERGSCRDENCLKKVYRERIGELRRWHEAAPEDKDIFGNYVIQRDNFIFNPYKRTNEPVKTEDCLTLKPSAGNRVHFSFVHVGANAHTCSMEGHAVFTGSGYQSVPDADDPDAPRTASFRFASSVIPSHWKTPMASAGRTIAGFGPESTGLSSAAVRRFPRNASSRTNDSRPQWTAVPSKLWLL